ncbi:MAG: 3'-5' exonuclease [Bacteroidetes bacterium]|jgi:DNA polymerase III alpha subunit (gram-positive type)|nr:3'-5' exonuclease [Bacteroidota bacterium]
MNENSSFTQEIRQNKPVNSASIELANLIFFDIETTGLRPDRGAEISEVSIINRNSHVFTWKKKTKSDVDVFSKHLPDTLKHLKNGVVVGHNLSFDFWFISYEADRLGIAGPNIRFIDTLSLARKILPDRNSYQLNVLLKEFDIKVNGKLHTAITDTEATRALFWKLIEKGGISTVGEARLKKLNWSSF